MKSVDGLEKILPSTFRKPAGGEQLILENHFVLYLSYVGVIAVAVGVFVGQWAYYGGLKEMITAITDDSSSNEYDSCKALQGDPVYNMKWTYESCKEKETNGDGSYAKLSNASSIVEFGSWGGSGWGYKYFPFTTTSTAYIYSGRDDGCTIDAVVTDYSLATIISPSATYVHNASCSQYIDQTQCAVYYSGAGTVHSFVDPRYVLVASIPNNSTWRSGAYAQSDSGIVDFGLGSIDIRSRAPSNDERCVSYERECATRAFELLFEKAEACHPCSTFKNNSPFLCTKSKTKTTLEILSLSVSNTLAVFSFLVAVAPMILSSFARNKRVSPTKGVHSKEEEDDDDSV